MESSYACIFKNLGIKHTTWRKVSDMTACEM